MYLEAAVLKEMYCLYLYLLHQYIYVSNNSELYDHCVFGPPCK